MVNSVFSDLLRRHRGHAGVSQLALSLAAGVSQRHLSYLEVGRASPSREMTGRLAQVLGLTLAESNEFLLAAGFAPRYERRALDDKALASGQRALEALLRAAEPFPAFVTDADANVIRANDAALPLVELARPAGDPLNLLWATFHPKAWRGMVANLNEIAPCLLRRFQRERVLGRQSPPAVWSRVGELPGVAGWLREPHADEALGALLTIDMSAAGQRVRWLSTITTLGTPLDLTLQEYRVEWFLPADDARRPLGRASRRRGRPALAPVTAHPSVSRPVYGSCWLHWLRECTSDPLPGAGRRSRGGPPRRLCRTCLDAPMAQRQLATRHRMPLLDEGAVWTAWL